jgi:hypothetical protein
MATSAEIVQVRAYTGQSGDDTVFTDPDLSEIIDAAGSVESASAEVWRRLAAHYTKLVDTKEAGSEHRWGTLSDKAMKMAEFWEGRDTGSNVPETPRRPRTIAITRV